MAIKLIGLDLDGTLFNSRKKLTAHTCAVLAKAIQRGIHVVPATGRPRVGLPQQLLTIPGIQYAVVTNGAAVCDLCGGKRLFSDCMPRDTAAEILRRTRSLKVVQGAFIGDWGYMEESDRILIRSLDLVPQMQDYLIASRRIVDNLEEYVRAQLEGPEKVVINFLKTEAGEALFRDETTAIVEEYPGIAYMSGGIGNIEIIREGVGKGTALLRLGGYLGIAPEEIMAVGDSENDLDMIQKAGLGVAMANSEKVILEHADAVTGSNDEDGAAAAIERFALHIDADVKR